jgi:hypothetical protein
VTRTLSFPSGFGQSPGPVMPLDRPLTKPRSPVLLALGVFLVGACNGQGEGDLCSQLAAGTNSDCQDGLVCTIRPAVVSTAMYGVCCPSNPAQATAANCLTNASLEASTGPSEASSDVAPLEGAAGDAADATAPDGGADATTE